MKKWLLVILVSLLVPVLLLGLEPIAVTAAPLPLFSDLSVTLTDGAGVYSLGEVSTYTFTVNNNGPDTAENFVMTADLPANFINLVSNVVTSGFSINITPNGLGQTLTLTGPSLAPAASVVATLSGISTGSPGFRTITATVSSSITDPNQSDNSSTDVDEIVDVPPTIVQGYAEIDGEATPAAANGNPASVPFTANMSGWFSDILDRTLSYQVVSSLDNATVPNNVTAQVSISGSQLTYTPAASQGNRIVTILLKANNGFSDSEGTVKVVVTVHPVPLNIYRVDFDGKGGTPVPGSQFVIDGGKAAKPVTVSLAGYEFTGWFTEGATTPWDFAARTVNGATTLQAGWSKIKYPITYHLGNGINAPGNPILFSIGDEAIALQAPTRSGYSFKGWFDAETGGNKVTSISSQNLAAVTLYAQWTALAAPIPVTGEGGGDMSVMFGIVLILGAAGLLVMKSIKCRKQKD